MSPEEGAREYEENLKRYLASSGARAFDLFILGLGEDGHAASLFPESSSLSERKKFAIPVYVEKLRSWRITLTVSVLNSSSSKKAVLLKEIHGHNGPSQKYPAGLTCPVAVGVTWLIEREALLCLTLLL